MDRLEFETIEELHTHLQSSRDLTGAALQALDLSGSESVLRTATLKDNILLGCTVPDHVLALFQSPIVFPSLPNLPFIPFRSKLYSPDELLGGYEIGKPDTYDKTVDGKSYKHFVETGRASASDVVVTLARRLHDHGITDALHEFLDGRKVVAIMEATHLARYFANSVREEGLLGIATYGVIYTPGSAGTIQEVFQDAAQNHYKTFDIASPMIFLGKDYWQRQKPVYPLLTKLAAGQEYAALIGISDSREEILNQISNFRVKLDELCA